MTRDLDKLCTPLDVRLGDCIEGMAAMADRSVDHVICDPPYSARVHSKSMRGANGWKGEISVARELGFDHLDEVAMLASAGAFARLAKRWILVFCDVESSHRWSEALSMYGAEVMRIGAWIKVGGAPQFTGDRPGVGFEAIVIAHAARTSGRTRWNGGGRHAVWSHPIVLDRGDGNEKRVHTTQKPVTLMESLVNDFTDAGDLVLDPFAGSGTTGVAALRNGRRFIGFERDAKYHAIAMKRLSCTREQTRLAL